MNQISIAVPEDLRQWVETRIAQGYYVDAGDYMRDLMRRDRDRDHGDEETDWLRAMIAEGEASGIVDKEPEQVIEDIIAERRARRG